MSNNKIITKIKLFEKIREFESRFKKVRIKNLTKKSEKYQVWEVEAINKKTNYFLIIVNKKLEVLETKLIPYKKIKEEAQNMINFYTLKRKLFKNRKVFKQYLLVYCAFAFLDTYLRDNKIVEEKKAGMWELKKEYKLNEKYIAIRHIATDLNLVLQMHNSYELIDILKEEAKRLFISIDKNRWLAINTIYISMLLLLRYDELKNKHLKFNIYKYSDFIANLTDELEANENSEYLAEEIFAKIYPDKKVAYTEEQKKQILSKLKGVKK